jgi:phosphoglycerate dehydrogenase-like enzyme
MPLSNGSSLADHLVRTRAEVLVSCWSTPPLPEDLPVGGENELRYVCHLTGSVRKLIPRKLLERGLKVTNWGGTASRTVAECGLLLILSALRRSSHWAVAMHRDGQWKDRYDVVTESLFGRSVGLHGFGAVARELVPLLRPFGVTISTHTPGVSDELLAHYGVRRSASMEELFATNDVLVEVAALTPETHHLVNEKTLRLIQPGGVFVNIGRGAVVDEAALIRVAGEGRIQVALDVYEKEPLPVNSPFRGMSNVTLLPHIAGPTKDRRRDSGALACQNLEHYFTHQPLEAELSLEIYDHSS